MLNEYIKEIVTVVIAILTGVGGYLIFKTNQKNKNEAVEIKFIAIDKDIYQNDKRIRRDFLEQNVRNTEMFKSIADEIKEVHELQIVDRQKILVTEVTIQGIKDTVESVSDKIDTLMKVLINDKKK